MRLSPRRLWCASRSRQPTLPLLPRRMSTGSSYSMVCVRCSARTVAQIPPALKVNTGLKTMFSTRILTRPEPYFEKAVYLRNCRSCLVESRRRILRPQVDRSGPRFGSMRCYGFAYVPNCHLSYVSKNFVISERIGGFCTTFATISDMNPWRTDA